MFFLVQANAQNDTVYVNLSPVSGSPGDEVCVDVSFKNFKNIEGAQFSIKYDVTKLDFVKFRPGALPGLNQGNNFALNQLGRVGFIFVDDTPGETLPDGAVAFSLCFKIKGAINGSDCLSFDETGSITTEFTTTNSAGITASLPFKTGQCAKVNFVPPVLKPLRIRIDKGGAKQDDTVCVALRVWDFLKLKSADFDLEWDKNKLKFEYLSGVNLNFAPQGTNTPFYPAIDPVNGKMQIRWTSGLANATDLTLADSTALFSLCFKVVDECTSTCVRVSSGFTPKVITTPSAGQNVGVNATDGCIKVLCTKFDPVRMSFCDPTKNTKVGTGEEICIDVKVSDFDTIGVIQGTFRWDATYFDFVNVKNLNPANGVNDVTWDLNPDPVNGTLTVSFASLGYTTLPDNSTLFSICLKARGAVGTVGGPQPVKLPTPWEIINKQSAAQNGLNIGLKVETDYCPILIESAIKIIDTTIVQPSCKNPLGGKINMTIAGGVEPYTYKWSPNAYDATTKDNKDLPTGVFFCTITDAAAPRPNFLIAVFDLAGDLAKPIAKAKVMGTLKCENNSFVLLEGTGSSIGANYEYQWISKNGVILGADNQLTVKALSGTTYAMKVTDIRNGCSDTSQVTVAPAPNAPIANAGDDVLLPCSIVTAPASLNACKSSSGTGISYAWASPDGGTIKGKFGSCDPLVSGKGTYILTVTSTNGCSAVSKVRVIEDENSPVAVASVFDSLNCQTNIVTLDASASSTGAGVTYRWISLDGNNIANDTNIKATTDRSGKYVLEVRNALGCTSRDTTEVYDFTKDTVSVKLITPVRLNCDGTDTQIDASNSSKGKNITYKWVVAPGSLGNIVAGANTATPTVNLAGRYLFTVKNKVSQCEAMASVNVLSANLPQGVDAGVDSTLNCVNPTIELDAAVPLGTGFDYKWTTRDGVIKSGATTTKPVVSKAGTYVFSVIEKTTKCRVLDSLRITSDFEKPNAKIFGDKILTCGKDSIELISSGSTGADLFEWFSTDGKFATSTTIPNAIVTKAGTYLLVAKKVSNGCSDTATHVIKFNFPDKGYAGRDTVLCTTSTKITLTATIAGVVSGKWTSIDGSRVEDITNNITEVDSLKVGRNRFAWVLSAPGCPDFSKDTVEVFVERTPLLKDDILAQRNNGQAFNVPVILNDDIKGSKSWSIELIGKPTYGMLETTPSKGALRYTPSACYAGTQEFAYKICSNTCVNKCDTAKVKLNILEDPSSCKDIIISNTITPNGDGRNDVFRIDAIEFQPERFKDAELIIFNRWGDIVYKSGRPYANDWDGTNGSGANLPEGTYYYVLDLNLPSGVSYRGDITILR